MLPAHVSTVASANASQSSAQSATFPTIISVLRNLPSSYEMYIQRFKDHSLEIDDFRGMDAETLSAELINLKITELKTHANRMARELLDAAPH